MRNIFFGTFLAALTLSGCNDGDMDIDRVDFSEGSIENCSDSFKNSGLLFKIVDSEVLILELEKGFLGNRKTQDSIDSKIPDKSKLSYRYFDGTVSKDYFCNTVTPATPSVLQEIVATGGTIRALTTPKTDGSGFNHGIVIHDAVLVNNAGEKVIERRFSLGTFGTAPPDAATGVDLGNVIHCNDTLLYRTGPGNNNKGMALVLDLEEGMFPKEITTEQDTITSIIGEGSRVFFDIFDSELPDNYYCMQEKPGTPVREARYEATFGKVRVVTSEAEDGNGIDHQILLESMILLNSDEERLHGANTSFGTYTVKNEDGTP
ncbi:hypothetical protein [Sinomicrobium weinanense]|uniref:Lipoprotein n=1 Tax=Sinomicrobium weinanense TaxID=2842200 RepID=A0A926Q2U0_9FLAO|nr:hypothetical protein [Sinomicrobium weinanense]MBC9795296.1 hypothetical protein [Sinomicrobium weinanense]MBU3125768.1 hypothetical protein [Sinomicrobium weinanense]